MNSPGRLDKDYSANSLGILSDKVRAILKNKIPDSSIWIPDTYEQPSFSPGQTVDVVFFGDFFRKFLETGNWTPERYRVWCLGAPTKKFFTKLAGLSDNHVSILPRHLLFDSPASSGSPDLQKDAIEFVYAGRLTASKRILTMIWSVFFLQQKGIDATLSLYGAFYQEEKFCDCPGENPYKDKVLSLLSTLNWKHPPRLHGNVGPQDWLKHELSRRPAFYSLSVLPFEDFSVSVAQAQGSGWPCILSNWGAHKDIAGTVMKLPLQVFESINETESSSEKEGKMIAAYISSRSFSHQEATDQVFSLPETVSLSELDKLRRNFLNKWGMNFQDVIRHRTEDLKDNVKWHEFMKEYAECFM